MTASETFTLGQPSVDFALLADHAEALNNKVYIHGGGWDRLGLAEVPAKWAISFAAGILVPWNATNQEHTITFAIVDDDGVATDFRTEARFNVGRPPHLTVGEVQRVMIAFPQIFVTFPTYGGYVLSVALNDVVAKTVTFAVVPSLTRAAAGPSM